MQATVDDVRTLEDLRRFVHLILCQKENLLADQFRMSELQITRGSELCGLQFCVRGPRSVRLAAVWAADQNTVYLYDAKGARYAKVRLKNRLAANAKPAANAQQAPAA
jgi:hypothetical protein